jgi:hypothetical protein
MSGFDFLQVETYLQQSVGWPLYNGKDFFDLYADPHLDYVLKLPTSF